MRVRLRSRCGLGIFLIFTAATAFAECRQFGDFLRASRKALLVGNGAYTYGNVQSLSGVRHDLEAVEKSLTRLGFAGKSCGNLNSAELSGQVAYFFSPDNAILGPADTFLFYFSGHGGIATADKVNVLFGVSTRNLDTLNDAYKLQDLLTLTEQRLDGTNIVVIDACRRRVLEKGNTQQPPKALDDVLAPRGSYLAFATSPGSAAIAKPEEQSPFTAAMVAELNENPKLEIDLLFRRVRARVMADVPGQQPWTNHNLVGTFAFGDGYEPLPGIPEPPLPEQDDVELNECQLISNRLVMPDGQLRRAFFVTDLLRLQQCDDGVSRTLAARVQDGLVEESLVTRRLSINEARLELRDQWKPTIYDTATDDLRDDFPVEVELIVRKDGQMTKGVAGGGKLALLALHWGKRGHFEITGEAFRQVVGPAVTRNALDIVQDASQDPDFYEWGTPAAHAQTAQVSTIELGDTALSRDRFIAWEREQVRRVSDACAANKPRVALYWLGYAAHGIQDLVFHGGITNAEHAYRDYVEDIGIDVRQAYDTKLRTATSATIMFFQRVLDSLPATCRAEMLNPAASWLTVVEKVALRPSLIPDLTPWQLIAYRRSATAVKRAIADGVAAQKLFLRDRWVDPADLPGVQIFIDEILPPPTTVASPNP